MPLETLLKNLIETLTRACALYVDSSELSIVLSMKVCSLNDIHFLGHISTHSG